jgi:hypothetical protein
VNVVSGCQGPWIIVVETLGSMWREFRWLKMWSSGRIQWALWRSFRFHKSGISSPTEPLSAFLCHWVSYSLVFSWRYSVRLASFTPRPLYSGEKSPWYPLARRLDGPQSRSGCGGEVKEIPATARNRNPVVQPVLIYYTDWAAADHLITRATLKLHSEEV